MQEQALYHISELSQQANKLLQAYFEPAITLVAGLLVLIGFFLLGTWLASTPQVNWISFFPTRIRKNPLTGLNQISKTLAKKSGYFVTAFRANDPPLAAQTPCRAVLEAEEIAREAYYRLYGKGNFT